MIEKKAIAVFWFRRDLRIEDNRGFYEALNSGLPVVPIFIFDTTILDELEFQDARLSFILHRVQYLQEVFEKRKSSLWIFHGRPLQAFHRLLIEFNVKKVFTNDDYEPAARKRDDEVNRFLGKETIPFFRIKDHLIFHKNEIIRENGQPYRVFTPYLKKWVSRFSLADCESYHSENLLEHLYPMSHLNYFHHGDLGFKPSKLIVPDLNLSAELLNDYAEERDYPWLDKTSHLGPHLRFGTISIRKVTKIAYSGSQKLFQELVWRNFYADILWHFPHVVHSSFQPKYDQINWENSEKKFERWCHGKTGYPLVDAGMRQLNATGYMHNRLRMLTASFLCKHLLIDWRWGEVYFAQKLLDFELASNNGGWQWASGSGCDAAPYFRVFNPDLQLQKFDPDKRFVNHWLPELHTADYPNLIVDHKQARLKALAVYKEGLEKTL